MDDQDCFDDYVDFDDDFDEDFKEDDEKDDEEECDSGEPQEEFFEIEDCYACVWLEDIQVLAAKMARLAPNASFDLDGVVDSSESAGEYMDFSITYASGKLTSSSSAWYLHSGNGYFLDCYPNYEEFNEEFWNEDKDCPLYTEEEYTKFRTWYELFFIGDGYKTITSSVPLEFTEEINITDASYDEEDDSDDEEDFDDED